MVGLFINTLPLRVSIKKTDTLETLLSRIQNTMSEISEHGDVPLAKIQALREGSAGSGLFDHVLVFENYPDIASTEKEDETNLNTQFEIKSMFEKVEYPFSLVFFPGKKLEAVINYDSSISVSFVSQISFLFKNIIQFLLTITA